MKKRQILAALLAVSCAASMAVPAFAEAEAPAVAAAETTELDGFAAYEAYELSVTTDVQKPTLKVTLPTSTSVLVNPYRIEITLPDSSTTFDTVISPEMEITNKSGCAIKVGVKGSLQTYTVVKETDSLTAAALPTDETKYTITNKNNIDTTGLKYIGTAVVEEKDDSTFVQVGTIKEPVTNTDGTVKTKGAISITGYVASKNIKVATAPMKDPDIDKSNTLFIYVEGKEDGGEWATTFDAKKVAGVKDTKSGVMSTTGMMALTTKETSAYILYLNGSDGSDANAVKGYARVTGQASTAPTNAWMNLTDKFDTNFTFVVDAVANAEPTAPVVSAITLTGSSASYTFDATKTEDTATATYSIGSPSINVAATSGSLTPTITATGDNVNVAGSDLSNGQIVLTGAGEVVITVSFTDKGKTTTYKITVTVS